MEVKEQVGDPRFLEVMHSSLADMRKTLGLDAPRRSWWASPTRTPPGRCGST